MRLLSFAQLKPEKGIVYSRVHLDRLEKVGRFPRRVSLGGGGRVAWVEEEVDRWIEARVAARDDAASNAA